MSGLIKINKMQHGFSLVEVLVAVLVLAFGLLGLAGLQSVTLRNNQSAFDRSRATMAVYSIADIMRADMDAYGKYASNSREAQEASWKTLLANHLGTDAKGSIVCDPTKTKTINPHASSTAITKRICTVTITWNDSLGLEGDTEHEVVTEVQL